MPWNGGGVFNRVFSWVADKAAGLDISSSRMDTDTDDIASNGFGNCLTRDGQGQPTANLPMGGFRHTSVQNAISRSDYAAFGQVQDGLSNWTIASGTADALTAIYTPALSALADGQLFFVRATAANATTAPTFSPNSLGPYTITKLGGAPLGLGDIAGNLAEIILKYNQANTRLELLNPSNSSISNGVATTGTVWFTLASSAPSGWLMFDDTTMGSASSGANHAAAANLALFTILFNNISDTYAPLLTSTGGATTRSAQGTAAAAWANNCRMSLPKTLGRALAVAGAGSGLTSRALGQTFGEETHTLATSEIPAVPFSGTTGNDSPDHTHSYAEPATVGFQNGTGGTPITSTTQGASTDGASTRHQHPFSGAISGGGGAHNNMQPTTWLNLMIKQ